MFLFSGVTSVLVASASEELPEAMALEASPHVFRASRVVTASPATKPVKYSPRTA